MNSNKKTKKPRMLAGKKNILYGLIAALMFSSTMNGQTVIKSTIFGQNAWYIDAFDNDVDLFSAEFDAKINDIAASGAKYIRIGGIDPNFFPLYSWTSGTYAITTNSQVEKLTHLIDLIRGTTPAMEPIIEVGYNPFTSYYNGSTCIQSSTLNNISMQNQAIIAGNLVDYLNNTVYTSNKITYWIISNEPDLAKTCNPAGGLDLYTQTSASTIDDYIKEFATKMKDKDPNIKIIGPELAQFGNDNATDGSGNYYNPSNKIMDDLVSNSAASIMGTISTGNGSGQYYIDILSFHHYPYLTTRAAVISNPSNTSDGFHADIIDNGTGNTKKGLAEMILRNSTGRALSGSTAAGIACTEFNLGYNNTSHDESTPTGYADMIKDVGYRSFLGGQWMAEVLSYAMNGAKDLSNNPWGVEFMNPWSVQEGDCTKGKGYISSCGDGTKKRPTYWHYQLIATKFPSGETYFPNNYGSTGTNYKAFACTTPTKIRVIIMNQVEQSPRGSDNSVNSFKINFNNVDPPSADGMFKFNTGNTAIVNVKEPEQNAPAFLLVLMFHFCFHKKFLNRL
ncbi:MAG: hypothetical protein ACT4ON_12285 [Bacteroidota bacterium]